MLEGRREVTAMQRTMYVYTLAASVILALAAPASGGLPHLFALSHSAATTPRPTLATGAGFSVRAYVIPDPVSNGARPTLYARTAVGAVCTASVVYSTGAAPRSFDGSAQTVGSSGVVGWT